MNKKFIYHFIHIDAVSHILTLMLSRIYTDMYKLYKYKNMYFMYIHVSNQIWTNN